MKVQVLIALNLLGMVNSFRFICAESSISANSNSCYIHEKLVNNVRFVRNDYSKYTKIIFFDCELKKLPDNLFQHFINAQKLEVKSSLETLKKDDFKDANGIWEILFTLTEFEILEDEVFSHCVHLVSLEFFYTKMKSIKENAFKGLSYLKILTIIDSKLTTVLPEMFQPLHSLEDLKITKSDLEILPENLLQNNRNLKYLVISSPHLVLTESTLNGVNLSFLELQFCESCGLLRIPTEHLYISKNNLTKLLIVNHYHILVASNNAISDIKCEDSAELRDLFLSYNQLNSLQCIGDLIHLEILDVSVNKISDISGKSFEKLTRLKTLNLLENNIFNFDIEWIQSIYLEYLNVDGLAEYSAIRKRFPAFRELDVKAIHLNTTLTQAIENTLRGQNVDLL
jgi:Leucine-rich repeat (LRR) protein